MKMMNEKNVFKKNEKSFFFFIIVSKVFSYLFAYFLKDFVVRIIIIIIVLIIGKIEIITILIIEIIPDKRTNL